MDYILSDHARRRILRRKLRVEWVEITLADPARTENDEDDPTLVHALRPIPEESFPRFCESSIMKLSIPWCGDGLARRFPNLRRCVGHVLCPTYPACPLFAIDILHRDKSMS